MVLWDYHCCGHCTEINRIVWYQVIPTSSQNLLEVWIPNCKWNTEETWLFLKHHQLTVICSVSPCLFHVNEKHCQVSNQARGLVPVFVVTCLRGPGVCHTICRSLVLCKPRQHKERHKDKVPSFEWGLCSHILTHNGPWSIGNQLTGMSLLWPVKVFTHSQQVWCLLSFCCL